MRWQKPYKDKYTKMQTRGDLTSIKVEFNIR